MENIIVLNHVGLEIQVSGMASKLVSGLNVRFAERKFGEKVLYSKRLISFIARGNVKVWTTAKDLSKNLKIKSVGGLLEKTINLGGEKMLVTPVSTVGLENIKKELINVSNVKREVLLIGPISAMSTKEIWMIGRNFVCCAIADMIENLVGVRLRRSLVITGVDK